MLSRLCLQTVTDPAKHRSQATVTALHAEFEACSQACPQVTSQTVPHGNINDKLLLGS